MAAEVTTPRIDGVTFRRLESIADYRNCVALQRATWGEGMEDIVPVSILKVAQRVGGVTAGAFDESGRMLGFVFGLTGIESGQPVHWSDMLAVVPEWRSKGLGAALKLYQRDLLLPLGVETVYWTFDPLVAKNAHFNLNKLGCRVHEYIENMYGESASELHRGLGTDRFVVAWEIAFERVTAVLRGESEPIPKEAKTAPIANLNPAARAAQEPAAFEGMFARVEVPEDIQAVKDESAEAGAAWRESTRGAFLRGIERGYAVRHFFRDDAERCFYVMQRG